MPALTSLLQLKIVVLERRTWTTRQQELLYGCLEEIVTKSVAPRLNLTVLTENKRIKKISKLFVSDQVEYLHVSAPCTFR